MRLILIPAIALFAAACGESGPDLPGEDAAAPPPPAESEADDMIAGGPCSYEETIIDAHVIAIEDGRVELAESGEQSFYIGSDAFPSMPEPGEDFTIRWESITEGTCTPDIYTIIDGDVGGVE